MPELRIQELKKGDVLVLRLSGSLSGEESRELRNAVREALERGEKKILLDLKGVKYINSTGIGDLIALYTSALRSEAQFALANLTPKLDDILTHVTKLKSVFIVFPDVDDGINWMREKSFPAFARAQEPN